MVRITDFFIEPLFARMGRRFDAIAASRGLELRLVPCGLKVRSDPALLAQIFDHLVANATAYTVSGRVLMGCRRRGDSVSIEVWDTGPGLGRERSRLLIEPGSLTGEEAGRGLGLAVVDRLSRLLRHPLRVSTMPGIGTRISLIVPLADKADRMHTERFDRRMVVVIDDEEQVLEAMRLLLEAWQFDVLAAPTEDEAIALLSRRGRPPAGIIADYRLREGRTGTQAVKHIRDIYRTAIPSIIITGDATAGRLREAKLRGLVVLQKPVAAPHLHSVLAHALQSLN